MYTIKLTTISRAGAHAERVLKAGCARDLRRILKGLDAELALPPRYIWGADACAFASVAVSKGEDAPSIRVVKDELRIKSASIEVVDAHAVRDRHEIWRTAYYATVMLTSGASMVYTLNPSGGGVWGGHVAGGWERPVYVPAPGEAHVTDLLQISGEELAQWNHRRDIVAAICDRASALIFPALHKNYMRARDVAASPHHQRRDQPGGDSAGHPHAHPRPG